MATVKRPTAVPRTRELMDGGEQVTITLPPHQTFEQSKAGDYPTTWTKQADGSWVKVVAHQFGSDSIDTHWGEFCHCANCDKHYKQPACGPTCPLCAAGDLCQCDPEPE